MTRRRATQVDSVNSRELLDKYKNDKKPREVWLTHLFYIATMNAEKMDHSEWSSTNQATEPSGLFKQNLVYRAIGTIWKKANEKPPNMWKVFIGINNSQRLAFTAVKNTVLIKIYVLSSFISSV